MDENVMNNIDTINVWQVHLKVKTKVQRKWRRFYLTILIAGKLNLKNDWGGHTELPMWQFILNLVYEAPQISFFE